MKRNVAIFILLTLSLVSKAQLLLDKDIAYFTSKCPFTMPSLKIPTFNNSTYNIKDFGAIDDGKTINTLSIQKAITECNKKGGGRVIISAGTWLTAPIELLSNVNLVIEKGAILQFTSNHQLYPIIKAGKSSTTFTVASPIYSYEAENIAITGDGIIDGAGESWRPVKKSKVSPGYWNELIKSGVLSSDGKIWWPNNDALNGKAYLQTLKSKASLNAEDYLPAREFMRPYMVYFVNCKNILLENVTIRNSPKFVFYPTKCSNITITGAKIFNEHWAQNGDGIDISACKNVVIYNTTVSCGDDAICMKSSGKQENSQSNLENIIIANCIVYRGHGGFVIGSNTDGGLKNIFTTNCIFNGTDIGIRVKSNSGRGGLVQNIYIDSIEMDNIINEAITFDTYYEDVTAGKEKKDIITTAKDKIPEFTKFYISNINCKKASLGLYINGLKEMLVHDIYLNNINFKTSNSYSITNAKSIVGKNITFATKGGKVNNSAEIIFNDTEIK